MDLTDTIANDSDGGAVQGVPTLPALPTLPTLPTPSSVGVAAASMSLPPLRPNPAAHASYGVMPGRPRAGEPSPAVVRAAEQRRRAKQRRRIRRVAMLVVAIVVGALAGPPTVRWIADGLDKAGSTETELPPPGDETD